jgi:hypothetical protein
MRIVPAVEAEFRREIRNARALVPLISVSTLEQRLDKKFNRGFSYRYIAKLADKIARQSLIEADRTKIEERLAFTRENYRMMREELLKIVYWTEDSDFPRPRAQDRIEAAKNVVVMMDLALLSAEIANGMYKKPVETIAREIHYYCQHHWYLLSRVSTTTQTREGTWFVPFRQKDKTMVACLHQARAIDYRCLSSKLATIDDEDFERVKSGFRLLYR